MKKIILIFILCLVILTGCRTNTQPEKTDNIQTQTETKTFRIGDSVQLGDYILTVHGIEDNVSYDPNDYNKPKDGYKYFAVEVSVENKGSEVNPYNLYDFTLQDKNGYTYDIAIWVIKEPSFSSGDLQPGRKIRGWLTYEVSKTAENLELIYQPDWFDSGQVIVKLY